MWVSAFPTPFAIATHKDALIKGAGRERAGGLVPFILEALQ